MASSVADLPNNQVSVLIDEALDVAPAVAAIPDETWSPAAMMMKATVMMKAAVVTEATTKAAATAPVASTVASTVTAPRGRFGGAKCSHTEGESRYHQSN